MKPKSILIFILVLCIVIGFISSGWVFSKYGSVFPGLQERKQMPMTLTTWLKVSTLGLSFQATIYTLILIKLKRGNVIGTWSGQRTKWMTISLFCISLSTILAPLAAVGIWSANKLSYDDFERT